jgi:hypothetical protein
MSVTPAVLSPADYESRLQRYLFERAEEGRAVRVGEKEVSERAEIVARYAELFTRDQLAGLREAESEAVEGERERLYRLRKTCEAGLISAELAEREDALENAILAARVEFKGEQLPLRTAQAKLAVLTGYDDRDELGKLANEVSATFNDERLDVLRAGEKLEADVSGIDDPVERNEEEKGISLRELEAALAAASEAVTDVYGRLKDRWLERLLGLEREQVPSSSTSPTCAASRRSRRSTPRSRPCRSAWIRSRASASISRTSRTSSSTSTTGRRSHRGPA